MRSTDQAKHVRQALGAHDKGIMSRQTWIENWHERKSHVETEFFCVVTKVKNIRYIADISNISNVKHDIGNR